MGLLKIGSRATGWRPLASAAACMPISLSCGSSHWSPDKVMPALLPLNRLPFAWPHHVPGFCYVNDIVLAILELLKYNQR